MKILLLFVTFFTFSSLVRADLRYYYLKVSLTSEVNTIQKGEGVTFWLEFENTDTKSHSIVLPAFRKGDNKVIFFSFFTEKNDFYTEVYREPQEITMDTSLYGGGGFRYLRPEEKFRIPVFFGDQKNFDTHIEAHHKMPDLPEGKYEVLAWYQPWNSSMAQYAFNPIDIFGHDASENPRTDFFDMPLEGTQSNYCSLTISNSPQIDKPFLDSQFCPVDCKFCANIEKGNWSKVEASIDRQTMYKHNRERSRTDSTWRMPHRNVAWLGPNPEAILASLPTWTGRVIIFKNSAGFHYYSLTWQLGKIYKARSRFASIFYWIGFRRPPFDTSEVDYCKLVSFALY